MSERSEQIGDVLEAAANALTDSMVERLATSLSGVLEITDRLSEPDTRDAVMAALDGLTRLHKSGDLNLMFDTLQMLGAAHNAATDGMVERGAALVEHLISNVANEEVADLAHQTNVAMREARQEASTRMGSGKMAALKLLGQPETLEALHFLVRVSAKLRKGP